MTFTADQLRTVLCYEPDTGFFYWRCSRGRAKVGGRAGMMDHQGYWRIHLRFGPGRRQNFRAHRLAWLYMTGEWPKLDIDHRDTDRLNNRWSNLREATRAQNCWNKKGKAGKLSPKGAHWHKRDKVWRAKIYMSGRYIELGTFASAELAGEAYAKAANDLFGEFARAA